VPNLAASTRGRYAQVWDSHIRDCLGDLELREITRKIVGRFRAELQSAGIGAPTVRKAMLLLQSVLALAEAEGRIAKNPAKVVKKPRQNSRSVRPLAPEIVEAIRSHMDLTSATLVSVLAYAGLRPGEPLDLVWSDIRDRTIHIRAARKTRAERTVRLLGPLAADLAAYRLSIKNPRDHQPVFARRDGQPWRDTDYRNWRKRAFDVAAANAGVKDVRPDDLRHSFVSLLIQEGQSVVEVARQAGHSPEECLRTYAHVFEEFDPAERVPAEERIRVARDRQGRKKDGKREPARGDDRPHDANSLQTTKSRRRDSNPRPPLYESGALAN
jgi:integrase